MQSSNIEVIPMQDISELESLMICEDGTIKPIHLAEANRFTQEQITTFCVMHGLYQFPTWELIEALKTLIKASGGINNAIEIGAGSGCIGRHIGIKMVDSKLQEQPDIKEYYEMMGQPIIKYGKDVEKIDGLEAIIKYRPLIVLGCWITTKVPGGVRISDIHGIDERKMFTHGVQTYIHVGNLKTHVDKVAHSSVTAHADFLLSRSLSRSLNVIQIIKPF